MSLLDSEEILENNADLAVLNDHANYRGVAQGLPSFDECKFGDIFWVLDEGKFYIRGFENWQTISHFDVTTSDIFKSTIPDYSLVAQGPKNYRIKFNRRQQITGIGELYHGGYDADISSINTIKINYSNETI